MLRKAERKKLAAERDLAVRLAASRKTLEKLVKRAMNNSDSYDHIESGYFMSDKGMRVTMTFRGTNGFGSIAPSTVLAILIKEDRGISPGSHGSTSPENAQFSSIIFN